MKWVAALVGMVAVMPATALFAGTAQAAPLLCVAERDATLTLITAGAGCGATGDATGRAWGYSIDGVGYAEATHGGNAAGLGIAGGTGASEADGAASAALGVGPGSIALASTGSGGLGLALSGASSQAVIVDAAHLVRCHGSAALAWNVRTGAACFSTGLGAWSTTP